MIDVLNILCLWKFVCPVSRTRWSALHLSGANIKGKYMRRAILLLGSVIIIAGCMPKTSSYLVETATTTQKFCYSLPRDEVEHLLEGILRKCFHHPSRPGGFDDIFEVTIEELPNVKRYSLAIPVGVGFGADVTSGADSCETEVQMYAAYSTWERTISDIGEAIHDEEVRCPSKHLW